MSDYSEYLSPDLLSAIQSNEPTDIIEVRTGSDSDFLKIAPVLESFREKNIPYILRILSAHRTPESMMEAAQEFPEIFSPDIQAVLDLSNLKVKFCIAAAGGSAHIAGMTASETLIPVLALPVESSSMGIVDSTLSMIDMPPGIPNGFLPNYETAIMVSQGLYNLSIPSNEDGVGFYDESDEYLPNVAKDLMNTLGLQYNKNAKVHITQDQLFSPLTQGVRKGELNVIIPTILEYTSPTSVMDKFEQERVNGTGAYMGIQKEGKVNYTNAILFAAQVIGVFNPTVRKNLETYRQKLSNEVRQKELKLFTAQFLSPLKKQLIDSGLWPEEKVMTLEKGNQELEDLGYELFYRGKNADLYLVPNTDPIQVLMVRSDRTSVFDIKLDLEIEGKGAIQTQISKLGATFATDNGFHTCFTDLPKNIPESLKKRCQTMELCKPLTMEVEGEKKGLELIMRNYNTGSFFKAYTKGENPYNVELPEGMKEWDKFKTPLFTPTTKDVKDTPIPSEKVRNEFPELITKIEELFAKFTKFAYEKGYVIVDTKVEVFLNAKGEVVLGDEIFTPESSRFIKKEDFETGKYVSADKQIIRNLGEEFGWKERFQENQTQNPTESTYLAIADEVNESTKRKLLEAYENIFQALAT